MIHSRVVWMLRPVDKSITVSAPQRIAHTIFSTSSSTEDGHRRVADIGVDLGEEVAADDHRLGFGVVDIGGDDGPAARHFAAHELRRDEGRQRRAEALPVFEARFRLIGLAPAADILAMGDIDHLARDNAGPRQFELGHRAAGKPAQRLPLDREGALEMGGADIAVVLGPNRPALDRSRPRRAPRSTAHAARAARASRRS